MAARKITRKEEPQAVMEDRLTSLPDSLQLHILSLLDARKAVQTLVLSKPWVSLWTSIPVLNFSFRNFNRFVRNVLRHRDQTAKLDKLTFDRCGDCSSKILREVVEYAFLHGAKELVLDIDYCSDDNWPIRRNDFSESLTSLKLSSHMSSLYCPLDLGSFKNLTLLSLERAMFTQDEPFSGFPLLEKLRLCDCQFNPAANHLIINAPRLTDLTISINPDSYISFDSCELTTPKLIFFECGVCDLPLFRIHGGLPALETVVIEFYFDSETDEQRSFHHIPSLLSALDNAKSLTITWLFADLLSSFPDELVKPHSLLCNLKCLRLWYHGLDSYEIPPNVKAYLLRNSRDVKPTMIDCDAV